MALIDTAEGLLGQWPIIEARMRDLGIENPEAALSDLREAVE